MFVSNDLNYFHNASMRCGSSQKIGFSWRFTEHFAAVLSARRVSTQLLCTVHSECDNLCYLEILARNYLRSIRGILHLRQPSLRRSPA